MDTKELVETWGRQVLLNYLKSRTATAAAGGSMAIIALPKLIEYLGSGGVPTTTQIIIGALVGCYIIARGLADHGKEAVLMEIRKQLMVAVTNGNLNSAKTTALHNFVETGDLKGLLSILDGEAKQQAADDGEDKPETEKAVPLAAAEPPK